MAAQIDLDRKPSLSEWMAEDVWFAGLLRDTWAAYREGYRDAHDQTMLRLGKGQQPAGPQVKGA